MLSVDPVFCESYTCKIIIIVDFNGTLKQPRPYNTHDRLLRDFVNEHDLNCGMTEKCTFYHQSGASSSQIDYIMYSDSGIINEVTVGEQEVLNLSSHVHTSARLLVKAPGDVTVKATKSLRQVNVKCGIR